MQTTFKRKLIFLNVSVAYRPTQCNVPCKPDTVQSLRYTVRNMPEISDIMIVLDHQYYNFCLREFVIPARNAPIGGGSYWAGRAAGRPLFGPCGPPIGLARPLLTTSKHKILKVYCLIVLNMQHGVMLNTIKGHVFITAYDNFHQ